MSRDRTHEECADCPWRAVEPPPCPGHVAGPSPCAVRPDAGRFVKPAPPDESCRDEDEPTEYEREAAESGARRDMQAALDAFLAERQELRTILHVTQPSAEGTVIAEFDPQPSPVEAARQLVDDLKSRMEFIRDISWELDLPRGSHSEAEDYMAAIRAMRARAEDRDALLAACAKTESVLDSLIHLILHGEQQTALSKCQALHHEVWQEIESRKCEPKPAVPCVRVGYVLVDPQGDVNWSRTGGTPERVVSQLLTAYAAGTTWADFERRGWKLLPCRVEVGS